MAFIIAILKLFELKQTLKKKHLLFLLKCYEVALYEICYIKEMKNDCVR